jgi:P2 family phage major capsid protein
MAHQLSQAGRAAATLMFQQISQALGVDATHQYTIDPSVLQTLNELIVLDGTPFLNYINVTGVPELKGEKIFMAQGGLISKRTKIDDSHERVPKDYSGLTDRLYELFSIETDVALAYALIDAWAKFPEFAQLWNSTVRKAIANDRVRVGFNGVSHADTTDPTTYPNGEDICVGWPQQIRVYDTGSKYVDGAGGAVVLGTPTFPNLDYLVSVTKARINPIFINDPDLVALISQDLSSFEEAQYWYKSGRKAEEKGLLLDDGRLMRNYGGLPSYSIPFMPNGMVLVTSFKNLSLYYQTTSWRRLIRDWAPKNRYEDFTSRNEGYVIEELRKVSLVDNIQTATTPQIAD